MLQDNTRVKPPGATPHKPSLSDFCLQLVSQTVQLESGRLVSLVRRGSPDCCAGGRELVASHAGQHSGSPQSSNNTNYLHCYLL